MQILSTALDNDRSRAKNLVEYLKFMYDWLFLTIFHSLSYTNHSRHAKHIEFKYSIINGPLKIIRRFRDYLVNFKSIMIISPREELK